MARGYRRREPGARQVTGAVVPAHGVLVPGKRTSASFLHNGTRAMFEKAGFTFERHTGKSKTVMRKTVAAA